MVYVKAYSRASGPVRAHYRRSPSAGISAAGVLAVLAVAVAARHAGGLDALLASGTTAPRTQATITRVIDGDTITARDDRGRDLGRVRLLGLDAPELARDGEPAMCGSGPARAAAEDLMDGQTVTLVGDTRQPDRDRYGRLLRYVDLDQGGTTVDATERLVRGGYAPATARAATHDRARAYIAAQRHAQDERAGVWGRCQ